MRDFNVPLLIAHCTVQWLLVGAVLSIVKGAMDGENPGIFSDGATVGFPGPLTLRRSFAARHGGLRPPQLFSKPMQVGMPHTLAGHVQITKWGRG